MAVTIGRRELLVALGGAAAWPLAAQAQQAGKIPTVGYLWSAGDGNSTNLQASQDRDAVRQGAD